MLDFIKTIVNALKVYIDEKTNSLNQYVNDKVFSSRSDWEQNDESAENYIENKPFYDTREQVEVVIANQELSFSSTDSSVSWIDTPFSLSLIEGQSYIVLWDDVEYVLEAYNDDGLILGNSKIWWNNDYSDEYENPPFVINKSWIGIWGASENSTHTLKLTTIQDIGTIQTLDSKFIPDNYVKFNEAQSLSSAEQLQARINININNHSYPEFFITDKETGYDYIVSMVGGKIIYESLISGNFGIDIYPTQMIYGANDELNTDGMIIVARCQDGTTKEIELYTCSTVDENGNITITYEERGNIYTVSFNVEIIEYLEDFTYVSNGDGTVTITGWKGTCKGEPSTEMILPDDPRVIL